MCPLSTSFSNTMRTCLKETEKTGARASNKKHDPAVLRLYLASVAMCWECTLQMHTRAHTSHFSRPSDSCECSVTLWLLTDKGSVWALARSMWRGISQMCARPTTSKIKIWILCPVPCCGCFPGHHEQQARVVRRQQWETYMFLCTYGSSSSHDHSRLCSPH